MLKAENLNVYYGKIHALKDVSFDVHEGEIVALIGANGAGKSTTLKTISGILHSKTGKIEFMGEDISHIESYKLLPKGLAHVPEGRRIFLQMTVEENLEMGGYINKRVTDADHPREGPRARHAHDARRRHPLDPRRLYDRRRGLALHVRRVAELRASPRRKSCGGRKNPSEALMHLRFPDRFGIIRAIIFPKGRKKR